MPYVEDNLVGDERVLFKTKVSWSVYMPGITMGVLAAFSFVAFVVSLANSGSEAGVGHFCLFILTFAFAVPSVMFFIEGYILTRTTEIAVTTRRLIGKTGVLSRRTFDLQHDKVESVTFDQSPCARMFGSGTVVITGSGGTAGKFKAVDAPQAFRKAALEAIDEGKGRR